MSRNKPHQDCEDSRDSEEGKVGGYGDEDAVVEVTQAVGMRMLWLRSHGPLG